MQNICKILQLTEISIMAVERDKSRREGMLLRMSARDSVPLTVFNGVFGPKYCRSARLSLETLFLVGLSCKHQFCLFSFFLQR